MVRSGWGRSDGLPARHIPSRTGRERTGLSDRHTLDEMSLRGSVLRPAVRRAYAARGTTDLILNLLSPRSLSDGRGSTTLGALSRPESKYLLILRRFHHGPAPGSATPKVSGSCPTAGSHPNIFFTKGHLDQTRSLKKLLLPSFRWSQRKSSRTCWRRRSITRTTAGGTLGECLDVLLYEDPSIRAQAAPRDHVAAQGSRPYARPSEQPTLSLTHARDQKQQQLRTFDRRLPRRCWNTNGSKRIAALGESPERFFPCTSQSLVATIGALGGAWPGEGTHSGSDVDAAGPLSVPSA